MGHLKLAVEVVHADADGVRRERLEVDAGTTLEAAIRAAGMARFVEPGGAIGVFGRLRQGDDSASAGDRIEIYRPLKLDPKARRRLRARSGSD